jgi:hypothetical protein
MFAALFAGTGAIGIAVAAVAVRPPHSAAAPTSSLILFMRIPPLDTPLTRNTGGRFAQLAERSFRQENILVMSASVLKASGPNHSASM